MELQLSSDGATPRGSALEISTLGEKCGPGSLVYLDELQAETKLQL